MYKPAKYLMKHWELELSGRTLKKKGYWNKYEKMLNSELVSDNEILDEIKNDMEILSNKKNNGKIYLILKEIKEYIERYLRLEKNKNIQIDNRNKRDIW